MKKLLEGKVAIVAGATRHAGRGIAIELGAAGATVYCTGRSTTHDRSERTEPGTVQETAALVNAQGARGFWAAIDHSDADQVETLFEHVIREEGKVDILVNAISGKASNEPFLKSDLATNLRAVDNGTHAHIVTTHIGARHMNGGLIVHVSDREWDQFYALEKSVINRLPIALADEFRPLGLAIVGLLPGAFFKFFDVMSLEDLLRVVEEDPNALKCHTPRLVGRAVVVLASDPEVIRKSGALLDIKDLIAEYGFADIDGRQSGEMW